MAGGISGGGHYWLVRRIPKFVLKIAQGKFGPEVQEAFFSQQHHLLFSHRVLQGTM